MRCSLLAVLALATASCTTGAGTAPTLASVALPASAALDSAYRRGDADAVAALLTDSAVISAEGIPDLVGRRTIRDLLARFFSANDVAAFTLKPSELVISGELAFERGTFIWSAGPKGASPSTRNGRYAVVRVRESDGVWRMHRYIENCLPAPCP